MSASPGDVRHASPRSACPATLREEESVLFAAAARALRAPAPDPLSARESALTRHPLWLRTGAARSAPMAMPEQPLAPGVLGALWRRLRAALELAAHDESR